MLESKLQEIVSDFSSTLGLIRIRINVTGRKGWPDYGYGYHERLCFIEFKKLGEKPEPLQFYVHNTLRSFGFRVYVVDNIEQGKASLIEWKSHVDSELERLRRSDDSNA